MAIISETYLITLKIDTLKAVNFPGGFRDPKIYGDNGYNWNSYPNWDLNYLGREADFTLYMLADFQQSFASNSPLHMTDLAA